MTTIGRAWYRLLGTNLAGAAVALLLLIAGFCVIETSALAGWTLWILAATCAAGAAKFLLIDRQRGEGPGRRIVVDGVAMHILAEGRADDAHPILWIGGGHGEGLVMAHLHRAAATRTRSVVFDRAGAGWSELGTLPLTIKRETAQLARLLEVAGERGPFVLAGHSFGGLFALNFASRYPGLVAGIVAMDPTPPANVTWAGRLSFGRLLRLAPWRALALQLGLRRAGDPEIDDTTSAFHRCVADWAQAINRNSLRPKSVIAEAMAFRSALDEPFDMVNGEGALGDIPLVLLLANPHPADDAKMRGQVKTMLALDAVQEANFWSAMDESMAHLQRLSRRSRTTLAPPGTSHMFPYEHPEFVLQEVLSMANVMANAAVTSQADATAKGSPAR